MQTIINVHAVSSTQTRSFKLHDHSLNLDNGLFDDLTIEDNA